VVFVGIDTPEDMRDLWDRVEGRVYHKTAAAIG
jgi:hypothetical protein